MYSNMKRCLLLAGLGFAGCGVYRALKPRYQFRDQHVVITGGSRGLGLVLARKLARMGARISICSRDQEELARAEDDLKALGANVLARICDVTNRMKVEEFLANARIHHGPVDVADE